MSADSSTTPPPGSPPPADDRFHRPSSARRFAAPVIGAVLVVVGIGALAGSLGYKVPDSWWSFLFLIPAAAFLYAAQRRYNTAGRGLDRDVVGMLFGGVIFTALFVIGFFNLNSDVFGSIVLIAIGIGLLARHYWPRQGDAG